MQTVTINVYEFSELSEKARARVLEKFRSANVEHDWWEFIYADAENCGIKLTGFDLGCRRECSGEFIDGAAAAREKILEEYQDQEDLDIYKIAAAFEPPARPDEISLDDEYDADQADAAFLRDLLGCWWYRLEEECEWLCSDEAVIDFIEANEYRFFADGRGFHE